VPDVARLEIQQQVLQARVRPHVVEFTSAGEKPRQRRLAQPPVDAARLLKRAVRTVFPQGVGKMGADRSSAHVRQIGFLECKSVCAEELTQCLLEEGDPERFREDRRAVQIHEHRPHGRLEFLDWRNRVQRAGSWGCMDHCRCPPAFDNEIHTTVGESDDGVDAIAAGFEFSRRRARNKAPLRPSSTTPIAGR
jgi:hypothetical protein